MFKLRYGYLLSGIITGCILLVSFVSSLPDGKLHMFFCNVGQGDAAYIRFPDNRDMLVDGGPNDAVLGCLGRYMPFWDRHIDIVALSHPQKDHMQGLISVVRRYTVGYFVKSDISNTSEGYQELIRAISDRNIPVKSMTRGQTIRVGTTSLSFLWPSTEQIARMNPADANGAILGTSTGADLNDGSLVFFLRYGSFDALFPGDADVRVESRYAQYPLADRIVEVLKVPHHGAKTGMTKDFVDWVKPEIAVISVGKNTYGHPSRDVIDMLQSIDSTIHRTDQEGDIEVVSDGKNWSVILH